jgi:hypothetical protein
MAQATFAAIYHQFCHRSLDRLTPPLPHLLNQMVREILELGVIGV